MHDIAWAPAMGRSYHLIATASREPTFRVSAALCIIDLTVNKLYGPFLSTQIHKLNRKDDGSLEYVSTQVVESTTKSNVWRVAWNATGTVLATSAEDGTLSLWRKDFSGAWINVQNLPSGVQQKMMHFYRNP